MEKKALVKRGAQKIRKALDSETVREQFSKALGASNGPLFAASILEIVSGDERLSQCAPGDIINRCLKAATLRLPLSKELGWAHLVAHWDKRQERYIPALWMGWKSWVQLAHRTGEYKWINSGMVLEGEEVHEDRLSGRLSITGAPSSETVIGYFASFGLKNGFQKAIFWSMDRMRSHVKNYCSRGGKMGHGWTVDFNGMARKTVTSHLLKKWGPLEVDSMAALTGEGGGEDLGEDVEARAEGMTATLEVEAEMVPKAKEQASPTAEKEKEQDPELENGLPGMDPDFDAGF